MGRNANPSRRLDVHIARALNKIRKPSTAEEITDLLNGELDPGDRSFHVEEVAECLRNAIGTTMILYWPKSRPRR
jgi:hypothetical protein